MRQASRQGTYERIPWYPLYVPHGGGHSVLGLPVWETFGKSNIQPKLIKNGLADQYHTTPPQIKRTVSQGRSTVAHVPCRFAATSAF
eukprot:4048740-Prymnesium_polylepis.1